MAYPKPSAFEPLSSSDPVPADTEAMTSLGKQYTKTAAMIEQQASDLRKLSSSASDGWKSKAGTVFVSKASSLAARITQAEQRYATAGKALTAAAGPMYDAQQQAYAAVQKAQDAQQQMTASAPGPAPAPGSPKPTAAQKAAAAANAAKYSAAEGALSQARSSFNSAVEAYRSAADAAAREINNELSHDPLTDSWFEQHFGWLLNFFHILAYIVMGLAILALLIACPFTAGFIAGILSVSMTTLATVGTFIDAATLLITIGQTVFDGIAAHDGLESWTAFGLDILGLATFGLGKGAEMAGENLVNAGKTAAEETASETASSAAKDAYLEPRAAHNAWVQAHPAEAGPGTFVFSPTGMASGAESAGKLAGNAAAQSVGKAAEEAAAKGIAGNAMALGTMSGDIAKQAAELNAINSAVPNVAKVGTMINGLRGLAGVSGIIQWGGFSVSAWSTFAG